MRKTIIFILLAISNIAIAQTRLAPLNQIEQEIWGKDVFPTYINEDVECQMIVSPSFVPPSALYIGLKRSSKDMNRLAVKDQKKVIHEMNSDSLTIVRLSNLIKHAVNTSSYTSERLGNDGVSYFLFDHYNGASVWTPDENSNTDVLVKTLSGVMAAVKKKKQKDIDALMPRIDSLTHVFKTLYPEDYFDDLDVGSSYTETSTGGKTYYVFMQMMNSLLEFHLFNVKFVIPQSWYDDKEQIYVNKIVEKYESVIKNVGRYVFTETTMLDGGSIYIQVDDNQLRSISKGYSSTLCFILHEEDLTEERLKNIITTCTLP